MAWASPVTPFTAMTSSKHQIREQNGLVRLTFGVEKLTKDAFLMPLNATSDREISVPGCRGSHPIAGLHRLRRVLLVPLAHRSLQDCLTAHQSQPHKA